MKRMLAAAVLGALALAAPAAAIGFPPVPPGQALSPELAPGGVEAATYTIVRLAVGRGLVGSAAFRLTTSLVEFTSGGVHFRSLRIRTLLFGQNAVKLRGIGVVDGRRVPFTAVGVHDARPGIDVFRLGWNHGAARGGVVTSGEVFIR